MTGSRRWQALERHRLLCAHRDGPYGVARWNRAVERLLMAATGAGLARRSGTPGAR